MRRPASNRASAGRSAGKSKTKHGKSPSTTDSKAAAKPKVKKMGRPKMQSRRVKLGREYRFDRAVRSALKRTGTQPLKPEWIQAILDGFGDTSLKADDPYVTSALSAAATCEGPVLQCGAGPMTLLLAIVMQRRSEYLWCMEHNPSWAQSMRSVLKTYDLRAGQVVEAPAEAFGDHIWYVVDVRTLPKAFGVVLCDGSNVLPTGLRGVVRRMQGNLSERCVFLVRNTKRPKDLDFASKWAKSVSAPFVLNDVAEPFVKISMRDRAAVEELEADRVLTIYGDVSEPEPLFAQVRQATKLSAKRSA